MPTVTCLARRNVSWLSGVGSALSGAATIVTPAHTAKPASCEECEERRRRIRMDDPFERSLTRNIHERFCCNRGFAAATSLDAVGTASRQAGSPFSRSTYCFKYASLPRGSARLSRLATDPLRAEPP